MNAVIFGASGGLAMAIADDLLRRECFIDLVTRKGKQQDLERHYANAAERGLARVLIVDEKYSDFTPAQPYDAYFFTQALFSPKPFASMNAAAIQAEVDVGLTDPIQLTHRLLSHHVPSAGERRNYCFIGSTSAYAGFRNTSVYCAVKHGLLGFVRAMNDEYSHTDTRFWLFSVGTMNTEMGVKLTEQDPASFLAPEDVAERIVEAICSPSNMFEPELMIRRRTIRFLEKQS